MAGSRDVRRHPHELGDPTTPPVSRSMATSASWSKWSASVRYASWRSTSVSIEVKKPR
jgi:hypothetical protein